MSFLISGLTANIQLPCPERNVPAQFLMCCSPSHVAGSIFCPPTKIPKPSFTNDFRCLVPPDQGASPGLAPTFREDFSGAIRTDGKTLSQVLNSDWTSAQRHFFLLGQN